VRGNGVVCRALEDDKLIGLGRNDRDRLHGRGAGTDHGYPPAREAHLFVRPTARVVARALVGLEARELRKVGCRKAARGHDAVGGRQTRAAVRFDHPALCRLVKGGADHARVEFDIAAQIEPVRHVVGIAQKLRLGGIALAPVPLLLQGLVELIRILHAFHIAARAWIAVPVPGAAHAAASLEHARSKVHAAQPMQHVESSKAGTDDDHVEIGLGKRPAAFCLNLPVRHG
jgi:hypothetical protein